MPADLIIHFLKYYIKLILIQSFDFLKNLYMFCILKKTVDRSYCIFKNQLDHFHNFSKDSQF